MNKEKEMKNLLRGIWVTVLFTLCVLVSALLVVVIADKLTKPPYLLVANRQIDLRYGDVAYPADSSSEEITLIISDKRGSTVATDPPYSSTQFRTALTRQNYPLGTTSIRFEDEETRKISFDQNMIILPVQIPFSIRWGLGLLTILFLWYGHFYIVYVSLAKYLVNPNYED